MIAPLSAATATRLEKSAIDNGFDLELPRQGHWLGFASTQAPLRIWLTTLGEELLRLGGHKVKVEGLPGAPRLTIPTLEVRSYELLGSDGARPVVGQLRRDKDDLILQRQDGNASLDAPRPLRLKLDAPRALRLKLEEYVGCKIWVAGALDGKVLRVARFGLLLCKDKDARPTGSKTSTSHKEMKR